MSYSDAEGLLLLRKWKVTCGQIEATQLAIKPSYKSSVQYASFVYSYEI